MATCVENCRLCQESLPPKHRRTIFTETFGLANQLIEVLGYIPRAEDGMSKNFCGFSFTKLNKLSNIAHRLEALKNEKFDFLKMLRACYVQRAPSPRLSAEKQTCGKSRQETSKHPLFHSPTPRKVKKPLHFTPSKKMILPKTLWLSESCKRKRHCLNSICGDLIILQVSAFTQLCNCLTD